MYILQYGIYIYVNNNFSELLYSIFYANYNHSKLVYTEFVFITETRQLNLNILHLLSI